MNAYSGHGDGSKVAIPRLERRYPDPSLERKGEGRQEKRIGKACNNCRKRKVKCSGEHPRCLNCETTGLECFYDPARRDKLRTANHKTQSLVTLLSDLRLRVSHADKQTIDDTLQHMDDDYFLQASAAKSTSAKRRKHSQPSEENDGDEEEPLPGGEAIAPASIGSNEDLDLLDEDLMRSKEARETGYAGKNTTVAWLRTLRREAKRPEGQPYGLPYGPAGADRGSAVKRSEALHDRRDQHHVQTMRPETSETTFYLDGDSLEPGVTIQPYDLPPLDMAEKLFECYMRTVYTSFPVTSNALNGQFQRFIQACRSGRRFPVPDKWLALLNLCFAIGSNYSVLSHQEWQTDGKAHLVYMTRAVRLLGLKDDLLFATAPDLPTIQAIGLLSFYYMTIGHVSRAWIMIGIAIRFALSLGLHLRNEDPETPASKKETLARTWWSLHAIESLVSSATGRPCVLAAEDCTVALPQVFPGGGDSDTPASQNASSNTSRSDLRHWSVSTDASGTNQSSVRKNSRPSSSLDALIGVGLITQKVLSNLYAPRVATRSWSNIQSSIKSLLQELEEWRRYALPYRNDEFVNPFPLADGRRGILLMRFYYYSNVMLITRPCLCRTERRIKDQSDSSSAFNDTIAKKCVRAAQDMVDLLPDEPNPKYIFENGPWWSLVHNIMQSVAVLLLELSYQGTHMANTSTSIAPHTKKLILWLRAMGTTDPSSKRAYKVVVNIIRHSGAKFQELAEELLPEDDIDNGSDVEGEEDLADRGDNMDNLEQATSQYSEHSFPESDSVNTHLNTVPMNTTPGIDNTSQSGYGPSPPGVFSPQQRQQQANQQQQYMPFPSTSSPEAPHPFFDYDPNTNPYPYPSYSTHFQTTFDQVNWVPAAAVMGGNDGYMRTGFVGDAGAAGGFGAELDLEPADELAVPGVGFMAGVAGYDDASAQRERQLFERFLDRGGGGRGSGSGSGNRGGGGGARV